MDFTLFCIITWNQRSQVITQRHLGAQESYKCHTLEKKKIEENEEVTSSSLVLFQPVVSACCSRQWHCWNEPASVLISPRCQSPGESQHFCQFQVTQSVPVSQNNIPITNSIYKHSMTSSWVNGLHFLYLKYREATTSDVLTVSRKDFPVSRKDFPLSRHMAVGFMHTPRLRWHHLGQRELFPIDLGGEKMKL